MVPVRAGVGMKKGDEYSLENSTNWRQDRKVDGGWGRVKETREERQLYSFAVRNSLQQKKQEFNDKISGSSW